MAPEIPPIPTVPGPDVIGTPEGDNEFAPDQPLHPTPPGSEEIPRGSEPDPYKQDHP